MSESQAPFESPLGVCLDLLRGDRSPDEAAQRVAAVIPWIWPRVEYRENLPRILAEMQQAAEWRRWQADSADGQQLVAIHALYRAAGHVDDAEASLDLTGLAKDVSREAVIRWLGQRECECCVRMRTRLETKQERER